MSGIVIVGAGQAGASLAEKLRKEGYDGKVTIIGSEPYPPYERPPLSKSYLLGERTRERLFLRPVAIYAENDISLRLGVAVSDVDADTQRVIVGPDQIAYDHLVFTTGSVPIRLPAEIGGDLDGVHLVRSLADIDSVAPRFVCGARVLIVGGGYIGLEAAAVAAKLDLNVTLVEMAPRILGRVSCKETANVIRATHIRHGVDIREGVGLARLFGEETVTGAEFTDGTVLEVDFVVVGIGVRPNIDLAKAIGVGIDNGIATDEFGRTNIANVWAAGDCTSFPHKGSRIRLESVQNAIDQAEAVAQNILGAEMDYVPNPWFWSDQYDLKLQIAGLNTGYDQIVARNSETGLSHWYFAGGRFVAVDAINAPRDYMVGKRILETGKTITADQVANPSTDLKALIQ